MPLCPPLRLSPQVCSEAAAPRDCAHPLTHGGCPNQDSALSLHGHSLPPPSPSTLWLCGIGGGGWAQPGLWLSNTGGLRGVSRGRCPGHHQVVGRVVTRAGWEGMAVD